MPAARLQPLPFPESSRLLDLIEQDPGLFEPGLRILARRVPLPQKSGGIVLEALAGDAAGRCVLVRMVERVTARCVEESVAARAWISESLATLRALCPQLGHGAAEPRVLLLASGVDESAWPLLSLLEGKALEILEIRAFDSPSGLALSVSHVAAGLKRPSPGEGHGAGPREPRADRPDNPLAGMALTAEELAEFRLLAGSVPPLQRAAAAEPRIPTTFHPASDFRGAFLEN